MTFCSRAPARDSSGAPAFNPALVRLVREPFVVADHLVDDEAQEFLRKLGIELRLCRQLSQPRDLTLLAAGVGGGQVVQRLVAANRLRHLETLGEHVDQRRIDIVDALAISVQQFVGHPRTLSLVRSAFCGRAPSWASAEGGRDRRQGLLCRGIGVRGSGR